MVDENCYRCTDSDAGVFHPRFLDPWGGKATEEIKRGINPWIGGIVTEESFDAQGRRNANPHSDSCPTSGYVDHDLYTINEWYCDGKVAQWINLDCSQTPEAGGLGRRPICFDRDGPFGREPAACS